MLKKVVIELTLDEHVGWDLAEELAVRATQNLAPVNEQIVVRSQGRVEFTHDAEEC